MIFRDRKHAGQLLAQKLKSYKSTSTLVLALPRGGVPVAEEIANSLQAPLDVLIVRKIGAPYQPELAVGAICEDSEPFYNDSILFQLGLEPDDLGRIISAEREKIKKQTRLFRQSRALPSVVQKIVIVVDDGLATGATMAAAVKYLKKQGAMKVVIAVPVAATSSIKKFKGKVDDVVVYEEREDLMSVGQWYYNFSQVSDEEVTAILMRHPAEPGNLFEEVEIPLGKKILNGDLTTFPHMKALIVFAHGSGSSRKSPRNQEVARYLNQNGFGTLLFDLLTDEEAEDRRNVFDIDLLSQRLASVTNWLRENWEFRNLPIGFFGASTGAGAALKAASKLKNENAVFAVVSRGGRPDLAGDALKSVKAPTLLLVGGRDFGVIELNQQAQSLLENCELSIVAGATHLFEEPGTLEEVSRQASEWFREKLPHRTHDASQTL